MNTTSILCGKLGIENKCFSLENFKDLIKSKWFSENMATDFNTRIIKESVRSQRGVIEVTMEYYKIDEKTIKLSKTCFPTCCDEKGNVLVIVDKQIELFDHAETNVKDDCALFGMMIAIMDKFKNRNNDVLITT